MNDLLIKLRQQLTSMIEEIDSYKIPLDDTIVIRKADLKWIKHLQKFKYNDTFHAFEYKNGVQFYLSEEGNDTYSNEIYSKLMNGSLEILILNKMAAVIEFKGYSINYELEDEIKTTLRNLYNPIEEENEGDSNTQND